MDSFLPKRRYRNQKESHVLIKNRSENLLQEKTKRENAKGSPQNMARSRENAA
jgi:hypothetical protein